MFREACTPGRGIPQETGSYGFDREESIVSSAYLIVSDSFWWADGTHGTFSEVPLLQATPADDLFSALSIGSSIMDYPGGDLR